MNRWIYLLRATRPAMVDSPTDDELVVLGQHFSYLERLTAEGTCVLAGPSISPTDTFGLCVLDVEDAMVRTLSDNGITVPLSCLKAANKDFQPVGPPRAKVIMTPSRDAP